MKNRTIATLVTAILACLFMGCIESPLFNHADASTSALNPVAQSEKCPLEFTKSDLCASIEWVKNPTEEESGAFTLRFWSLSQGTESGPYIAPSNEVFVKLWMPSMGHGSSPVTIKPALNTSGEIIAGVYDVSDVFFTMHGNWEIQVQLRQARKVIEQAKIDVRI